MEDPTFATPVHEVHLEIAVERTLAPYQDTKLQILEMNKMAATKRGLPSQNSAKLANLDMGHPPEIS